MLYWPALVHHGGCSRSFDKHLPDSGVGIQQIDSCVAFVLQHLLGRKRERKGKGGREEGREGGREGGDRVEKGGSEYLGGGLYSYTHIPPIPNIHGLTFHTFSI